MYSLLAIAALTLHLTAQPEALEGGYALNPAASEDVAAVVDAAVRDVNRMMRGRMRSALLEQLRPSPSLTIRAEGSGFVITSSDGRDLRAVPGAPAARITTPKGEPATVVASMRSGALIVRVQTERAVREQEFVADRAQLIVTSTIELDALDAPIKLRSVYVREAR